MNNLKKGQEKISDESALKLCQRNSAKGLKILFDRYYKSLVLFSYAYTNQLEISEDLVQQIFIKFWEQKIATNIQGSVKSYLYASVKNASINYSHKNKTYLRILEHYFKEHDTVINPPDSMEAKELKKAVEQTANQLPKKCQKVFQLVVLEDMKYKNAAQKLNISVNTVKTQMRIAYATLRKNLKEFL